MSRGQLALRVSDLEATKVEDDTTCCCARQDTVWVRGPGDEPWGPTSSPAMPPTPGAAAP